MECMVCGKEFTGDKVLCDYEVCLVCSMVAHSETKTLLEFIPELCNKANCTDDPEEKIVYFKCALDMLYEHKVKYYDKEILLLEQDVGDLIDQFISAIISTKLEQYGIVEQDPA